MREKIQGKCLKGKKTEVKERNKHREKFASEPAASKKTKLRHDINKQRAYKIT